MHRPAPTRRPRSPTAFVPALPLPIIRPTLHPCPLSRGRPTLTASASSSPSPPSLRARLSRAVAAVVLAGAALTRISPSPAHATDKPSPQGTTLVASSNVQRVSRATAAPLRIRSQPKKPVSSGGHGLEGQSFVVAGTAALFASAAAVAVTHPIDTLKTRRQAQDSNIADAQPQLKGLSSLPSLYKGVFSNILKEAPNAAIYLATYEIFKIALLRLPIFSAVPLLAMCVAGMLGDAVGSVVRVPAEIVNKRLQLGLSNGWKSAVQDAFLSPNGKDVTLSSWEAVLWRDVPYGGLQIAGYEAGRIMLAGVGLTGLPLGIVAGAGAGLLAAVLTTPADVLVTRMTTQSPQCYLETKKYMSPIATCKRIVKEEGFSALWTGALHRGLFYMPMIGLFFAAYEWFKFALVNPSVIAAAGSAALGAASKVLLSFSARLLPIAQGTFPMHLLFLVLGHAVISRRRNHREHSPWAE